MTIYFNEDSSGCKCQLDSVIQGASRRAKKKKRKLVEVEGVEEQEVKRILNKRKIRGVNRYLVQWKGFMAESEMWEKEEDLENAKELVNKFEGRLGAEVRRQEEVEEEKWNAKQNLRVDAFRRMELPGKYMAKLLYRWCNKKFKKEYLKKLERN